MQSTKCILLFVALTCMHPLQGQRINYIANETATAPVIDGIANESCWTNADWGTMDQEWFGKPMPDSMDFHGRYKAVWTPDRLYLLVEITDDIMNDDIEDPLEQYWEDDCLEVFIDEDNSGGDHQCCETAYNAFAYHISPVNYNVVDLSSAGNFSPRLYNDHLEIEVGSTGTLHLIELAIDIYDDSYEDEREDNTTVRLQEGKVMGFSLAYCDDDGNGRENFIGTQPGGLDSWMNADLFGTIELVSDLTANNDQEYRQFSLYPVPADEIIYLRNNTPHPCTCKIFDTTGTLLDLGSATALNGQTSFKTSALPAGLYYFLIGQDDTISTIPFEIMR